MDYFTTKNTVIVALAQIGVIVAGILAAGACHKWHTQAALPPPSSVTAVADYGFLALVFPLAWLVTALQINRRHKESAIATIGVFLSGIMTLLCGLIGVWYAVISPWFRIFGC